MTVIIVNTAIIIIIIIIIIIRGDLQLGEERLGERDVPNPHEAVVRSGHERRARRVAPLRAHAVHVAAHLRRVVHQRVHGTVGAAAVEDHCRRAVARRLHVGAVARERHHVHVAHARRIAEDARAVARVELAYRSIRSADEE